ncbi:MAG TPA: DUF4388 domain-containing protein, partial [Nitrospiria bacterium]|nr:DUF4388 domain-containing protein [Nitrospiria bacterium]
MAFFGRIEDLSIVDLIQYLHAGGKGGTLKLTRRNDTDFVDEAAYVYFQKGNIVHAVAPQRTCIGDLL